VIDTTSIPITDVHCHPFTRKEALTAEAFTEVTAFGGGSPEYLREGGVTVDDAVLAWLQQAKRDTIYFRHMIHRLAEFFNCDPDVEQIVTARNQAIAVQGYQTYTRHVFDSAGIKTLVVDFGNPLPQVPVEEFRADVGVEVVPIFRIEVLIAELLSEDIGWAEFIRRYDDSLAAALTTGGYRGLKSIIAYRTGLDISPASRGLDQGRMALEGYRRGRSQGDIKKLRDTLFCRALDLCIEYDVPMQVHTGMGDWEVQLAQCRPALLMDLLRYPAFRACRVLLVHTGYPYHAEAGYIANVLPNIWCDISEGTPFAGRAARRIIAEVLEMAPISRVCYGSDVYGSPEPFFASAMLGRRAVAQALQELVDDAMLSQAEAQTAAEMILGRNTRELYRL
jgi:uncharacterized protein